MKVYMETITIRLNNDIIRSASVKEAVSDALLMSGSFDTCLSIIKKRGYEIVDQVSYKTTEDYRQRKAIDLLVHTVTT